MSFAGNLETMALADILQWLSQGRHTGTLVISRADLRKSIFFSEGAIISSASTDPREYLGQLLVNRGFIDEGQLARAIGEQEKSGKMLGGILIENGLISAEDLDRMLRLKAEEGIFELFEWTEGSFEFLDGQMPAYEIVPISLDVQGLVLEGMQRVDEWQKIRELIPSPLAVPVSMNEALGDDGTGERERAVLGLINDDRSVEEICLQTHSSEFFVSKVLHEQARKGAIKVVRPRVADAGVVTGGSDPLNLLATAEELIARGELERAHRHLRAALDLDPTRRELLGGVERAEDRIKAQLVVDGLANDATPHLETSLKDLAGLDLTPQEGFVLSRINGTSDVAAIVTISPLPELQAQLVFWKLLKSGHIRLEPPAAMARFRAEGAGKPS